MNTGKSDVNPITCGRRNCARCTRWRHAVDFKWRWNYKRVKRGAAHHKKTKKLRTRYPTPTIDTVCRWCRNKERREYYASLTTEQKRAKGRRANENARKRRAKWEIEIHYARMAQDRAKEHYDDENVDIVPFRMWLLGQLKKHNVEELARKSGVDHVQLRRWANGYEWPNSSCDEPRPIRSVRLSSVDQVGVGMNDPGLLDRLYPYIEE